MKIYPRENMGSMNSLLLAALDKYCKARMAQEKKNPLTNRILKRKWENLEYQDCKDLKKHLLLNYSQ